MTRRIHPRTPAASAAPAWIAALTVLAAVALIPPGCSGGGEAPLAAQAAGENGEDDTARTRVERGPVTVTVEIRPKRARLSDEPELTLTIEAAKGVTVHKPPFGESIGTFVIRDFREPLPEMREDRQVIRQIYTLEPTGTGEHFIFPVSLTFVDDRPDGDGQEHSIETEGLKIEVASALETEAPSLEDLAPPSPPLAMLRRPLSHGWWVLGAAVLLGAALLLYLRVRRRAPVPMEKRLSPQELAFLEIKNLLESGLIDLDVKLFYVEMTGIVRRFIERTTGIRAPEQTTEEFLHETKDHRAFSEAERSRLKRFLESADLVKFAALRPGKTEVEESFSRAKAFIGLEREEAAA